MAYRSPETVPVGPAMTMYDPVFLGLYETGELCTTVLYNRNLLAAGEPGGGKSGAMQAIACHAALCDRTSIVLMDGKQVELGMLRPLADEFVGADIEHAIITLKRLQRVMNNRYTWLLAHGRRKIERHDDVNIIVVLIDEIAFFSATIGTKAQQEEFVALLRDLVARGRAAGIITVAATQRPSVDIIPTSLRDIFGFRLAFRCTTPNSSNIILGHGWAEAGFNAATISPTNQGCAYLIAEGGTPRLMKVAYLSDAHIAQIVDYATWIRATGRPADPSHVLAA